MTADVPTAKAQSALKTLNLFRLLLMLCVFAAATWIATAQVNGVGQRPYLGWSTFSEQTINSNFLTQANIQTQSDALRASGLQQHGFDYINIDSGWQGSFDAYGRPIPNNSTFPDIAALVAHIHQNGQKAGIYWIPGVEYPAVAANSPILGTPYHIQDILVVPYTAGNAFGSPGTSPYHYKIDFSKPGAQEYMNSVVALFASWGIDLIKLDGVTPGSDSDGLAIDNRPDVAAWSKAIAASDRPIWLTISWDLDEDYLSVWQQYANARRINQDVECEGRCSTLTDWPRIYERFRDLPGWENAASAALGWNDLDSLDIGDGALDGLTNDEKRSAVTLWALANAPMYLGGDLTQMDSFGKQLLSNNEFLLSINPANLQGRHSAGMSLYGSRTSATTITSSRFSTRQARRSPTHCLGMSSVSPMLRMSAISGSNVTWAACSNPLLLSSPVMESGFSGWQRKDSYVRRPPQVTKPSQPSLAERL